MKTFIKINLLLLSFAGFITACEKVKDLPLYADGTAVTISANKTVIVPTPADSNVSVVNIAWSSAKYASDSTSWKHIIEIDTAGRGFTKKVTKTFIGTTNGSLTGGELNNIMLNYGFNNLGTPYGLDVRVISSYGNNNERYTSNTIKIVVSPYSDPAILTTQNTTVTGTLATASQLSNTFSWTKSFNNYSGTVTYTLQYDSSGKNFASLKEIAVGASIFTKGLTVSEMNETALNEGVAGGTNGRIEYRIKATTAQGAIAYSNTVSVLIGTYTPFYNFYVVGAMTGWDINNPWELISDRGGSRWGKVFYTYAKLTAGDAFLFVKTKGDWNSKYGSTGGSAGTYDIGAMGTGADFTVSATGIYRLTIDLNANKVYIQQKQVGVVGNMQGWNPGNPIYGGLLQRDKFLIITPSSGSDPFKFHDGPVWDNSSPGLARWWGRASTAGLLDTDGNGPEIIANSTPYTRAIWDGTDPQQLKYSLSAGQLRVVGGAANIGNWDPNNAMNMTYTTNGIWTATVTFTANTEFKFVSSEGWSYNYGGSGGSGNSGTISFNGPNLSKPAGTYLITLNEYTQTYTIN